MTKFKEGDRVRVARACPEWEIWDKGDDELVGLTGSVTEIEKNCAWIDLEGEAFLCLLPSESLELVDEKPWIPRIPHKYTAGDRVRIAKACPDDMCWTSEMDDSVGLRADVVCCDDEGCSVSFGKEALSTLRSGTWWYPFEALEPDFTMPDVEKKEQPKKYNPCKVSIQIKDTTLVNGEFVPSVDVIAVSSAQRREYEASYKERAFPVGSAVKLLRWPTQGEGGWFGPQPLPVDDLINKVGEVLNNEHPQGMTVCFEYVDGRTVTINCLPFFVLEKTTPPTFTRAFEML